MRPALGQLPTGFIREKIAEGLNPTSMALAPDGRIMIVEKNGVIRIVQDDALLETPFLRIEVDDFNERGLGHMVFHPQFEENGYYYVFYTVPGRLHNRVSRFTAFGNTTIPGSELVILELDRVANAIHNGGAMTFGLDGYLYIATGDAAEPWVGDHLGNTNAKILRVDESGQPVPDNPWYNLNYLRSDLVYAYGLRNPFSMAMHPHTGEMYVNDVGNSAYEEVNKVERGAFYGWPKVEGKATNQQLPDEYRDPIISYSHTNGYCCIVGSAFYEPDTFQFPEAYHGKFFYSDYCTGHIRMHDLETNTPGGIFLTDGDRVIDIQVSSDGSMYYLERKGIGDGSLEDNNNTTNGTLWRVRYTGSGKPFISIQPADRTLVVGEDARFSVQALGEAPLHYAWYLNDVQVPGSDAPELELTEVALDLDSALVRVDISNAQGITQSANALLRVLDNHRPEPQIVSPLANSTYKAGDTIRFEGFGEDAEDGIIPADELRWKIDFHHGTHLHPAMPWTPGIAGGEWVIPYAGEPATDVWYRIYLTATDQDGLSRTVFRDLFPQIGSITVTSEPPGMIVYLDGQPFETPYTFDGVHQATRHLSAIPKAVVGDSLLFFSHWENEVKTLNREVQAKPEDQTFTAHFKSCRLGRGTGLTAYYFNNSTLSGEPVATRLDTLINYQFIFASPHPAVNVDEFSIRWKDLLSPFDLLNIRLRDSPMTVAGCGLTTSLFLKGGSRGRILHPGRSSWKPGDFIRSPMSFMNSDIRPVSVCDGPHRIFRKR